MSEPAPNPPSKPEAVGLPETPPARPIEIFAGLLIAISVGAIGFIIFEAVAVLVDMDEGPNRDLWVLITGMTSIWVGLLFATALPFATRKMNVRAALGLKVRWRVDVPLGIAAGLFGQFVIVYLTYLPVAMFDEDIFTQVGQRANDLSELAVGWGVIPFVISTAILAPIFEELFFRGLVLRSFVIKWGPTWGIITSGLLFGAFHFDPLLFAALSFFGMLLGYLAHKTGRIAPCVIAHIAFNSATVVSTVLL